MIGRDAVFEGRERELEIERLPFADNQAGHGGGAPLPAAPLPAAALSAATATEDRIGKEAAAAATPLRN